jgi:transcriptional antiterminator NusG
MSLQEPQEQFERDTVDSTEDQTPVESPLSESDTFAPSDEADSVDVPSSGSTEPSIDEVVERRVPAKQKQSSSSSVSSDEMPPTETTEGPAWYVIHCYSGYENKVRHNLEQRIETMGMKDRIFDVVIPTQEEIEVKDGKRRTVERHIFPGYVLVNMQLTEESWYVVRNTPGVTGFVGMGNNPTALRPEEVSQIIKRMEAEAPTVKVTYKVGERVRIIDGPFNDFRGVVSEIDMERTKVRVMVSFFGRETPVELDFLQVEKA